ncbi:MAG: sulfate adenylyltransferase [Epsilonproteobacteria bacterium]|nr:sulfate adenylyltransferase [Campylobacterota bacterium]
MQINSETLQDVINISVGLFAPLTGFMDSKDYRSVVDNMTLANGEVWTIPITLDSQEMISDDEIYLEYNGKKVAKVEVEDIYKIKDDDILKVYKTTDTNHPGVKKELNRGKYRIGGKVILLDESLKENSLNPAKTKKLFKNKTVAGFQTRNIPHKAHEYLHRLALEFCDALFINPLVGWKKKGDFSQKAVEAGYKALIDNYYTNLNIYFDTLKTPMRYAGPREAIFHAIIRKNLGCTHFIIGRDHAGVGEYYGKYEAQELAKKLQDKLDIKILLFKEPYYCPKCEQIVSENCCGHDDIVRISGTKIRKMLSEGKVPPKELMRKEVAQAVIELKEDMFIRH